MPRARRLASTVVVAALAVTGVAACNQAPDAVAYFGSRKIVTEAEVQRVYDDAIAKGASATASQQATQVTRQDIAGLEVLVAALSQLGKQRGFKATPVSTATAATQVGLPASADIVSLVASYQGWSAAALQNAQPAAVTDADLHDIYNRYVAAGAKGTYDQFATGITAEAKQELAMPLGLRNELLAQNKSLKIKINPRYKAPILPLFTPPSSSMVLVDVTVGTGAEAAPVKDLG
jgi:hypothetical protein